MKKKTFADRLGVIYAVLLFAFIYLPTVIMAVYSFNQQPSNKWWTGFTTEWYGKLFQDAQLWQTFGLSLKISLVSTAIVVVIGTLGAMGLTRYRFFGRNALTYSVYLPMIVPGVVFAVPIMALLVPIYTLGGLVLTAAVSAGAYFAGTKLCPTRVVRTYVPYATGSEDVDAMLNGIAANLDALHKLNDAIPVGGIAADDLTVQS